MYTPPFYRISLLDASGDYYYIASDGSVQTSATLVKLKYSPKNWDKTEVSWSRNMDYKGVFRMIKTEYQFVKDGAKILRHIYYNEGIEGYCKIKIETRKNSDLTYEAFYEATLNFKTAQDTKNHFNISLDDDSIFSLLKANANVPYEVPISWDDDPHILLDGINLYGKYFYAPIDATDGFHEIYQTPFTYYNQEGDFPVAIKSNQDYFESFEISTLISVGSTWSDSMFNSPCYLFKAQQDMDIRVVGKYKIQMDRVAGFGDPATRNFQFIVVVDETKTVVYVDNLHTSGLLSSTVPSTLVYDAEIDSGAVTIPAGSKVYILNAIEFPPAAPDSVLITTFSNADLTTPDPVYFLNIEVTFRLAETVCTAIRYRQLFDRISKLALESGSTISESDFLSSEEDAEDTQPEWTFVTCGDAIRGFQDDSVKIRTSFNNMFDDASRRWMLGLGLNSAGDKVKMEHLSYFFDKDTLIADLGMTKDLELTVNEEWLFNSLKVGMEKKDYDSLNGRDEFNQTTDYKLPFKRIVKPETWVSTYRWDMYGIETYRANLSQKKTTDSKSDNDTFVLNGVTGTLTAKLKRPNFSGGGSVSGVLDTVNSYNMGLSNARTIKRNFPLLASILYKRGGQQITFQTTDKNANLVSKFSTSRPTFTENANINVDDLGDPLWLPIIADFECQIPINLQTLLANPYGYFKFQDPESLVVLEGFLMEIGITPYRNSTYRCKMLLTPNNNPNALIR